MASFKMRKHRLQYVNDHTLFCLDTFRTHPLAISVPVSRWRLAEFMRHRYTGPTRLKLLSAESDDAGGVPGGDAGFLGGFPGGEFRARAGAELEIALEVDVVDDFSEAVHQDSHVRGGSFGDFYAAN